MELNKQNAQKGALAVGKIPPPPSTGGGTPGLEWGVLYPGPDGYVLTALAAATQAEPSGGTSLPGVTWAPMGLPALGTASQLLGVNTGATALEYKTLTAGSNITLTAAAGSITVAAANQLTIGSAVSGGVAKGVLVEDASGNLASTSALTLSGTSLIINSSGNTNTMTSSGFAWTYPAAGGYGSSWNGSSYISSLTGTPITTASLADGMAIVSQVAAKPAVYLDGATSQSATLAQLRQLSSTATKRPCGLIDATFNVATDAVWTGNLSLYAGDYTSSNAGKRLGVQIQSNGSAALVGFFGATPVVQPTAAGTTTGYTAGTSTAVTIDGTSTGGTGSTAYTLGDIVLALKSLGIIKT